VWCWYSRARKTYLRNEPGNRNQRMPHPLVNGTIRHYRLRCLLSHKSRGDNGPQARPPFSIKTSLVTQLNYVEILIQKVVIRRLLIDPGLIYKPDTIEAILNAVISNTKYPTDLRFPPWSFSATSRKPHDRFGWNCLFRFGHCYLRYLLSDEPYFGHKRPEILRVLRKPIRQERVPPPQRVLQSGIPLMEAQEEMDYRLAVHSLES
jgi:hypothetical protein